MEESRFLRDIPPQLLGGEEAHARTRLRTAERVLTMPVAAAPPRESRFRAGMRVRHERFGEGVILESQVHGSDEVLTVEFETAGLKRLDADAAPIVVLE